MTGKKMVKGKKMMEKMSKEKPDKKWMQRAVKKKGALHKQLGVPMSKKIPEKMLDEAAKKGGKLGKRARLAKTFKKVNK